MDKKPLIEKYVTVGIIFLFIGIIIIPDVLAYKEYKTSKTVTEMSDDTSSLVVALHPIQLSCNTYLSL